MKVCLVHDWLISEGGAEKVLASFSSFFPKAPFYTLFYDREKMKNSFFFHKEIYVSFLQKIPFSLSFYRHFLPLFPLAIRGLNVCEFDLVLSSSHAVAKGVKVKEDQLHICYCHTPMRYIWDLEKEHLELFPYPLQKALRFFFKQLRKWDVKTSEGVDYFIANSLHVAQRIERSYQRKAVTIYPPVNVDFFYISDQKEDYFVTHARLVPYKRVDLLVKAFTYMKDKKLVIIGKGPEEKKLKSLASSNIEFLGFLEDKKLAEVLSKARAYLFAAEEDFGIGVVEAQASGLPVIALAKGGALETVIDGKTGLFFKEAHELSLIDAIKAFEKKEDTFDPALIKEHASQFSVENFEREFSLFLEKKKKDFYENRHLSRRERNKALASFSQ